MIFYDENCKYKSILKLLTRQSVFKIFVSLGTECFHIVWYSPITKRRSWNTHSYQGIVKWHLCISELKYVLETIPSDLPHDIVIYAWEAITSQESTLDKFFSESFDLLWVKDTSFNFHLLPLTPQTMASLMHNSSPAFKESYFLR